MLKSAFLDDLTNLWRLKTMVNSHMLEMHEKALKTDVDSPSKNENFVNILSSSKVDYIVRRQALYVMK